jgi:hypothetical protein
MEALSVPGKVGLGCLRGGVGISSNRVSHARQLCLAAFKAGSGVEQHPNVTRPACNSPSSATQTCAIQSNILTYIRNRRRDPPSITKWNFTLTSPTHHSSSISKSDKTQADSAVTCTVLMADIDAYSPLPQRSFITPAPIHIQCAARRG